MPKEESLTRPQQTYARGLLDIRTGKASRRARTTRAIAGGLTLVFFLGLIGICWVNWLWGLTFAFGAVAGVVAGIYLLAKVADDRILVTLRVCNWNELERLLAEDGFDTDRNPDCSGC